MPGLKDHKQERREQWALQTHWVQLDSHTVVKNLMSVSHTRRKKLTVTTTCACCLRNNEAVTVAAAGHLSGKQCHQGSWRSSSWGQQIFSTLFIWLCTIWRVKFNFLRLLWNGLELGSSPYNGVAARDSCVPDGKTSGKSMAPSHGCVCVLVWEWSQLCDYLISPGVRSEAAVCPAVHTHSCSFHWFGPITERRDDRAASGELIT